MKPVVLLFLLNFSFISLALALRLEKGNEASVCFDSR